MEKGCRIDSTNIATFAAFGINFTHVELKKQRDEYEKNCLYFDDSNLDGWGRSRRHVCTFLCSKLCVSTPAPGYLCVTLGGA
jgi:hypothetical protein